MIASTRLRKLMRILPCATLAMIMPLRADHAMSADQSKPQTSAKPRKQSLPASTAPQQPATEKTEPATECAVESIDAVSAMRAAITEFSNCCQRLGQDEFFFSGRIRKNSVRLIMSYAQRRWGTVSKR